MGSEHIHISVLIDVLQLVGSAQLEISFYVRPFELNTNDVLDYDEIYKVKVNWYEAYLIEAI